MLVQFKSTATETITMFGDIATQLIKMMGMSGAIPGAVSAADIPAAINTLRDRLKTDEKSSASAQSVVRADTEKEREPTIGLSTRAMPLLQILERAAAHDAPVMWERA